MDKSYINFLIIIYDFFNSLIKHIIFVFKQLQQ